MFNGDIRTQADRLSELEHDVQLFTTGVVTDDAARPEYWESARAVQAAQTGFAHDFGAVSAMHRMTGTGSNGWPPADTTMISRAVWTH